MSVRKTGRRKVKRKESRDREAEMQAEYVHLLFSASPCLSRVTLFVQGCAEVTDGNHTRAKVKCGCAKLNRSDLSKQTTI